MSSMYERMNEESTNREDKTVCCETCDRGVKFI